MQDTFNTNVYMILIRAGTIAKQADVVASLTLEVLKGTSRAFDR